MIFFAILVLFLSLPILFLLTHKGPFTTKNQNLPPSPPKLPFIGNLHQIGPLPHQSLHALSKKYGPIMLLHLGHFPTLIISSPKLAQEVMKTHDPIFANRPNLWITNRLFYGRKDIAFTPYGDYWRRMRKICVVHLLSSKRVQSFSAVREEETKLMVEEIARKASFGPVNMSEMLNSVENDIICRVALGRKYSTEEGQSSGKLCKLVEDLSVLVGAIHIGDYFPYLAWLNKVTRMDERVNKCFNDWDGFLDEVINDHVMDNGAKADDYKPDLVDVMLSLQMDQDTGVSLTMESIKAFIMDLFAAGTDTSYILLEWAMAELVKNPKTMKKVQHEIRGVMKAKPMVEEDDTHKMDYMKAVLKEALRLHPPGPLLVPRESTHDVSIEGYPIPAKTRVLINGWAIGRDSEYWEAAEEFQPERFVGSNVDFRGNDFQFIPFGAGRRICPGMLFATTNVELILANMLHRFDWGLPDGLEELDMEEAPGFSMRKKSNLVLVATPRESFV
ncbi:Cytochrome P450 71A9 [Acorus calamus]|uniref:Cytochrome P450 71A9 n=1 Tax=Acorus calamus TaxID=4465 RepID=A0AAV9F9Y8_ACOCL|nr:Cytochrome P450 71A9 [Acorus calamus]